MTPVMSDAERLIRRTQPSAAALENFTLFENAPPALLQRKLGLIRSDARNVTRRAVIVVLAAWLPLTLLALLQELINETGTLSSFLWEVGVHARYLIAAPLLIFAEGVCVPYLGAIVREFTDAGLVQDRERGRFDAAVASTRELNESVRAEVCVIVLAYAVTAAAIYTHNPEQIPLWYKTSGGTPVYSPAGWWHSLVSLPLLLALIFGWIWRLALWSRLLWLIARLRLHLVASHPDRAGGLGFVGHSLEALSIVGLALTTIAAGRSASFVLSTGTIPTPNLFLNGGVLAALLVIFTAPLLIFTPTLLRTWQHGSLAYGALAGQIGIAFEHKWLPAKHGVAKSALQESDFSTTIDLYSIAANANAMRLVPVDLKNFIVLCVAMLIPFAPVVLLAVPANRMLDAVKSLLL
jgi:hypothetical protein